MNEGRHQRGPWASTELLCKQIALTTGRMRTVFCLVKNLGIEEIYLHIYYVFDVGVLHFPSTCNVTCSVKYSSFPSSTFPLFPPNSLIKHIR
jgi:hypothetical protein